MQTPTAETGRLPRTRDVLIRVAPLVLLLAGTACPHYESEERRSPVYAREIAAGLPPGIALDDSVAVRYDDERLVEIVSATQGGRAFRVDASGEHPLDVRLL